jgi:hypothetical protein
VIDREKLAKVQEILGTNTLAETIDASLDGMLRLDARRRLLRRIEQERGIGPTPDELRRLRAP